MIRRPPSRAELFARIIIVTCAVVAVWVILARETATVLGVVAEYDTAQQSMTHLVNALEDGD